MREVLARIAAWRRAGGKDKLVLVTHDVNIRALVNESVAQGATVVAQPVDGRLQAVGRVPSSTVFPRSVP